MLGILLGVATVVSAVLLADTQQVEVDRSFDQQRANVVVITGEGVPEPGFPAPAVAQVAGLPVAAGAGEVSIWQDNIEASRVDGTGSTVLPVVVVDTPGLAVVRAVVSEGAAFPAAGEERGQDVWLGVDAARRLGADLDATPSVLVGGRSYRVAGLIQAPNAYAYVSSSVVMPRSVAYDDLGQGENVRLLVGVRPGSAAAVADFAMPALDPGKVMFLQNATPPDAAALPRQVGEQLRSLGVGLGLFVGVVGLISVANTLAMTVSHRIRELGLRSALGWSRRRLATLVMLESVLAGTFASVLGAAIGIVGVGSWCLHQDLDLIVDPLWLLLATGGGVAAATIGGLLPALQAGSVSPMEALRS